MNPQVLAMTAANAPFTLRDAHAALYGAGAVYEGAMANDEARDKVLAKHAELCVTWAQRLYGIATERNGAVANVPAKSGSDA